MFAGNKRAAGLGGWLAIALAAGLGAVTYRSWAQTLAPPPPPPPPALGPSSTAPTPQPVPQSTPVPPPTPVQPAPQPTPAPLLTPTPVPPLASANYATEWVWLLSTYDDQLEELTRAMNEKYRGPLALSGDLSAEEWLDTTDETYAANNPASANLPNAGRCFAAAKAEFSARKKRLDDAFVQAFAAWTSVAYSKSAEGAVAVWQAVRDLRTLRAQWFGSGQPGQKAFDLRSELAKVTTKKIKGLLTKSKNPVIQAAVVSDDRLKEMKEYGASDVKSFSDYLSGRLSEVMGVRDPAEFDKTIKALTTWGDVVLDSVAYPVGRRPALLPQPAGGRPDYFGLGGSSYTYTRESYRRTSTPPFFEEFKETRHYNTAFAVSFNLGHLLYRDFGHHPVTVFERHGFEKQALGTVTLDSRDLEKLRAGETVEKRPDGEPNAPFPLRFTRQDVDGFDALNQRYEQIDQKLTAIGNEGERLWFAQVKGPDKAKAAAAIRLLKEDLEDITAEWDEEKVANTVWKWSLDMLAGKLAKAPAFLSPFTGIIDQYKDQFLEYLSRDLRTVFIQQLDEKSIDIASALTGPPPIRAVLPNRAADLEAFLALNPGVPEACATTVTETQPPPVAPQRPSRAPQATPPPAPGRYDCLALCMNYCLNDPNGPYAYDSAELRTSSCPGYCQGFQGKVTPYPSGKDFASTCVPATQ